MGVPFVNVSTPISARPTPVNSVRLNVQQGGVPVVKRTPMKFIMTSGPRPMTSRLLLQQPQQQGDYIMKGIAALKPASSPQTVIGYDAAGVVSSGAPLLLSTSSVQPVSISGLQLSMSAVNRTRLTGGDSIVFGNRPAVGNVVGLGVGRSPVGVVGLGVFRSPNVGGQSVIVQGGTGATTATRGPLLVSLNMLVSTIQNILCQFHILIHFTSFYFSLCKNITYLLID